MVEMNEIDPNMSEVQQQRFGGCPRLRSQYQTIASELTDVEKKCGRFAPVTPSSIKAFRKGTVLIPVEVLESYLEDLLNLQVSEPDLFIEPDRLGNRILHFSIVGLVFSAVCGVYAASSGASFLLSLALTICLASPFAVLWHFSPRETTMRRLRFAQILSREISRRRGGRDDKRPPQRTSLIESLLAQNARSTSAQKVLLDISGA